MNYTTPFKPLLYSILLFLSAPAFASYGYFGDCPSFISINGTFYEAASCSATDAPFINGADLGLLPEVVISYIEQQTWENSGDDVANGSFFYRVWEGSPSGAFIEIPLTNTDLLGGGNEKRSVSPALDIIAGLAAGTTFTCEFYYTSSVNQNGGGTDAIFESNGGANYQFSFTTDAPAPVELSQFRAQQKQEAIVLQWKTDSETNTSHFELERSDDGRTWTNIGQLRSKGYSQGQQFYAFLDEQPFNGKNYYRLNIVDFDGRQAYSPVLVFDFAAEIVITVYPNPVKNQLYFQIDDKELGEQLIVEIYIATGQRMLRTDGLAKLRILPIETGQWAPGLYVYRLVNSQGKHITQGHFLKH